MQRLLCVFWLGCCLFLTACAPETNAATGEAAAVSASQKAAEEGLHDQEKAQQLLEQFYAWALPEQFRDTMQVRIGMFTLGQLLASFAIILLTLILRGIVVKIVFRNLRFLASRTRVQFDDKLFTALEAPAGSFVLLFGLYLAIMVLPVPGEWAAFIVQIFRGVSVFILFWALLRSVDVLVEAMTHFSAAQGSSSIAGFAPLIRKSIRIFVIVIGVIMVLDNLGYDIGGILTTVGIGGAALAFAARDTIANLYGSVALVLDRPFKVGDWIQVGDVVDGDVEAIGLRSTKVRTWPKTVISIPNAVLANEMINNWSRMPKRRVKQVVGVTYDTAPETMHAIVDDIRQLLRDDPDVNQEFILVNWTDFGESALEILVYYFTATTKWLEYMEVRQRINGGIARVVKSHGSSVAFPTRTLHLEGELARKMAAEGRLPGDHGPQAPA